MTANLLTLNSSKTEFLIGLNNIKITIPLSTQRTQPQVLNLLF